MVNTPDNQRLCYPSADVAVADKENAVDGLGAIHDQLSPNEAEYDALSNGVPRP